MGQNLPKPNENDFEQAERDLSSPHALQVIAQLRAELRFVRNALHPAGEGYQPLKDHSRSVPPKDE